MGVFVLWSCPIVDVERDSVQGGGFVYATTRDVVSVDELAAVIGILLGSGAGAFAVVLLQYFGDIFGVQKVASRQSELSAAIDFMEKQVNKAQADREEMEDALTQLKVQHGVLKNTMSQQIEEAVTAAVEPLQARITKLEEELAKRQRKIDAQQREIGSWRQVVKWLERGLHPDGS